MISFRDASIAASDEAVRIYGAARRRFGILATNLVCVERRALDNDAWYLGSWWSPELFETTKETK